MHVAIVSTIVLLPLLVQATPTPSASNNVTITLTKSSSFKEDGIANVTALNAHVANIHAKIMRGFENFERNTGVAHKNHRGDFTERAAGNIPLTEDLNGKLWHGAISVGTPQVPFTVDFDTGSSDLFLPGANCRVNCQGHKVYNAAKSSTAIDQHKGFSLAFGDGSTVQGEQFSDTVSIAGLTATGQRIGAASTYSTGFAISEFPPDGLMGMAFQQIAKFNAPPVFQTLVSEGKTSVSEFAFRVSKSGSSSELTIGGTDPSKFTGPITFTPVTEVGFWQVDIGGINVGPRNINSGPIDAIVDTGTTLILGDSFTVQNIYASIPGSKNAASTVGQGFFTVPCNSIPSDVTFTLGGKQISLSADSFNFGQVFPGSADCVGSIMANDKLGIWILGDVFLQNAYTVFDVGNKRVGFATPV